MNELTFDRDGFNPSMTVRLHPKGRVIISVDDCGDELDVTLETHELIELYQWLGKVVI